MSTPIANSPISTNTIYFGRVYYATKRILLFYPLFTEALSNLLCLEGLRHGTSLKNSISIVRKGAQPSKGAGLQGKGWAESKNLFYVMRDSDFTDAQGKKINFILASIVKRLAPLEYKVAAEAYDAKNSTLPKFVNTVLCGVKGFFDPTLVFYFDKKSVTRDFSNDKRLKGLGLTTQNAISADHFGILGLIKYGVNNEWPTRLQQNPWQFTLGLIQMIASVILLPLALISLPLVALGHHLAIDRF